MYRQCLCLARNGRNEKKPPTKISAAVGVGEAQRVQITPVHL